ncbi:MAG: Mor transcription activator family protein [Ruminococcus sp.]
MDIDKLVSLEQLRGDQKELAELIGLEAYKKLISSYAGSFLYIQKIDSILKDVRDDEIREKFDGGNYGALAREYNLAEATVRDIVAEKRKQLRQSPLEGQMSFEE